MKKNMQDVDQPVTMLMIKLIYNDDDDDIYNDNDLPRLLCHHNSNWSCSIGFLSHVPKFAFRNAFIN